MPDPPPNLKQTVVGNQNIFTATGNIIVNRLALISARAAVVIVVAVAGAVAIGWYLFYVAHQPPVLTGDFNIAVAQFGQIAENGKIVSSSVATRIGNQIFDFLDSEFKAADPNLRIQVTHKIGILTENEQAEDIAQKTHANIVIYGVVMVVGNEVTIEPRFYVRDQPDTGELTGVHQLSKELNVKVTELETDSVKEDLRSRAAILGMFTKGMVELSVNHFDAALSSFEDSINAAETHGPYKGREVLYLFASYTANQQTDYDKATRYARQALEINPDYGRAFLAMGNVYYRQAMLGSLDPNPLDLARGEYQKAYDVGQPASAYIREKALVSLGNVYVIWAQQTDDPGLFALAIEKYRQMTDKYKPTDDKRLAVVAANAYFGLGAAYERHGDNAQAQDAYGRCIELAEKLELAELRARALEHAAIVAPQATP
jgi:tetratricopeptide (TPR) repeat protein